MDHRFDTPGPADLYVEIGSGTVLLHCDDVHETTVSVDGRDAEDVLVEQRGDQVVVIGPPRKAGFMLGFGGPGQQLRVDITAPSRSTLTTKLGSADLEATGTLGGCRLRTGSGDLHLQHVDGEALLETGSGDVDVETASGELRVKCGSGDVNVGRAAGATSISTGSGDVEVGTAEGPVQVKSGSGDLRVREPHDDLALSTASGDLVVDSITRGALRANNVSGDIHVGVPSGVPVWTDISCVTGSVRSNLRGAGQPADGQDYVELRARTVSGDIQLVER